MASGLRVKGKTDYRSIAGLKPSGKGPAKGKRSKRRLLDEESFQDTETGGCVGNGQR